jgi:hydroxymethylglutaryl-CoA synthase
LKPLEPFLQLPVAATYSNKDLDKALKAIPTTLYDRLVGPSTEFCQRIGNSYTASSFVNLLCLVSNERDNLIGRNIGVFSYGSGAIATLYTLHGEKKRGQFSLSGIADTADMRHRLDSRRKASVDEFVDAMALRVHAYGREGHKPIGAPANVNQGDFFLSGVTPKHHRSYAKAH